MTPATISQPPAIVIEGAFARTAAFLEGLGFVVRCDPRADGFLAGVEIANGELLVAMDADDMAGELLHEAGHLAVTPSLFRHRASGDLSEVARIMSDWIDGCGLSLEVDDPIIRGILQAGECEAIAWSYAAALTIGIDTRIPFCRGFEGEGLDLHDQVASGYYFGVHGLAAGGMTDLPRRPSPSPFPRMKRWLQV